MFEFISYLQFFTFIIGLAITLYVLFKNPKDQLHQSLALISLGVAAWNLSIFLVVLDVAPLIFGVRNVFAWASIVAPAFAWFVYQYPVKIKFYNVFSWATLLLGLMLFLTPFYGNFVLSVSVDAGYIDRVLNESIYSIWSLFFLLSFVYALILLIARVFNAKGVHKERLKQILIGYLLLFIPSMFTNLVLPLIFEDLRWNNLGPVFSIFLVLALLNAVFKYRLLNIKWIVGKSVLFSVAIGLILWVLMSISLLIGDIFNSRLTLIIGALLIAIFFEPIWHFFERIFLKVVHSGSYDPEVAQEELFGLVRDEGELAVLTKKLVNKFSEYFSTTEIEMLVLGTGSSKAVSSFSEGFAKSHENHIAELKKIIKANKNKIVEITELEWNQKYGKGAKNGNKNTISKLSKLGIQTLIPFTIDHHLAGILIFGKRRFDKSLSDRDIKFLDLVRSGISPALENAAKFEEIKQLYSDLSELDKSKTEFINVVSHGFRTPLSAIRWNLEMALEKENKLSDELRSSLEDVHDRSLFLISTLDRLFETLDIDSGRYKLAPEVLSAQKVLGKIEGKFRKKCKSQNINCVFNVKKVSIYTEEAKMLQLCNSLLKNSLQYTSSGGNISFGVGEQDGKTVITVEDDGIGIPTESLDKIWDKFYRAKNAILTYADGQGLGMYFVKKIVDLHHGHIQVETKVGKGTKFTIILPKKGGKK